MEHKQIWKRVVQIYDKLEEILLCSSLLVATLIIFLQIIMRYVFNNSLTWSEELARYIYIWQIWLGVSLAQRENAHIKVEIFHSLVKNKRIQAIVDFVGTIIWIAFLFFLVYNSAQLVRSMYIRGNLSAALRIPMFLIYAVLPISSGILSIRLIGEGIRQGRIILKKEG